MKTQFYDDFVSNETFLVWCIYQICHKPRGMFVTLDLQDSVCLYELEQRHFTGNDFPSLINFLAAPLKQLCDHFYHRNYRDDPDKKKTVTYDDWTA